MQVSYSFIQRSQRSIVKRQTMRSIVFPSAWRMATSGMFMFQSASRHKVFGRFKPWQHLGCAFWFCQQLRKWFKRGGEGWDYAGGQGVWIFFMEPSFRTPFDVPFVHNIWASPRSMSISISHTLWTQLRAWKLPSSGDPQGPCISPGFQAYAFHRGWIWLVHGDTASTFWYLLIFFDHWLVYICLPDLPVLLMDLMESDENHWMTKIKRKQVLHVTRECRSN